MNGDEQPSRSPAGSPGSLEKLLAARRVLICVGSGGVGKTTTAATLGLLAAISGRRVLVLTIDPARRLADALGLAALGHDIQQVPTEKLAQVAAYRGVPLLPTARLDAMMLDQKRAFDEVVERYGKDEQMRKRILGNAIYQQISTSLAGSHEYAAMSKLSVLVRESRYDLIILDTPPTENALDFLEAPTKVSEAVDSPALQWFIKPYLSSAGSWSLRLVGMGGAFVLRGLARFVGSTFLAQMAEFFVECNQVMVGFRERAKEVQELLRRPDLAFVLVCSPEPLSVEEALYFHGRLVKAAMPLGGFVVNRVHPQGPPPPAELVPLLAARPELSGFAADDLGRVADDLLRTYGEAQVLAASDADALQRIAAAAPLPMCRVPMFEQDIHDAQGLALVSKYLVP